MSNNAATSTVISTTILTTNNNNVMANYATLKAAIEAVIKQNGNNEITGDILQSVLLSMVSSLGANYQFVGVATPETNPGTPDQNVFYFAAKPGTYTNFNGMIVDNGEVALFKWNGSWTKETSGAASESELLRQTKDVASNDLVLRSFSAAQRFGGTIDSSGKWRNTDTGKHIIVPVSAGDFLLVTPGAATYCAVVTDYVKAVNGESLLFSTATGFTSRISISAVANRFTMPVDAKYFILQIAGTDGVEIAINALMLNSRNLLDSQSRIDDKIVAAILESARSNPVTVSIPTFRREPGIIDANGYWAQVSSANHAHIVIPIKGGQQIHIKAGSLNTQYGFVRSYVTPNANGQPVDFSTATGYTERFVMTHGTTADHTAPADAIAIVLMTMTNGNNTMVAEFSIDGADVMTPISQKVASVASGISAVDDATKRLNKKFVDELTRPVGITIPYVGSLTFNGVSFESGVEARHADYLLCSEDTIIEIRGELLNADRPIYFGYTDSIPAVGVTMVVLGIIDVADTFIVRAEIPAGKYFCFAENTSYTDDIAFYRRVFYNLGDADGLARLSAIYDDRILDTEYSALTAQPNSLYFFQQAYAAGFRAFKADMRLTADNKIVLCHDAGFTFDGNGRIIAFDSENNTPIHDLTLAQVRALEFAEQAGGNYIHPGVLDDFLVFCKRNRCVPYLTFRNQYIPETADALWASLLMYKMEERAIINLYPMNTTIIAALQSKQMYWLICNTRQTTIPLTQELIDETALNGCSYLCIYQDMRDSITPALVQYAASKNVRIWVCGMPTEADLAAGVTGFQDFHQYPIV